MRKLLDGIYDGAAWLAALFMVGLLVMVLLSIAGRQLGFYVPGTDAYAGYLMAASGFLALAHTLNRGEHIRVTLVVAKLRGRLRWWLEVWALVAASFLAGITALYSARLVWHSHKFKDISTGNDATPLWIPQLGMAIGTAVLLVAFLDQLIQVLRGTRRFDQAGEVTRNE